MKVIDLSRDERIHGYCATTVCSYDWYLKVTSGAERNLSIQRAIIKDSKAYVTLRADLRRGCILPPVVLAISKIPIYLDYENNPILDDSKAKTIESLQHYLENQNPSDVYVIDGLQRTNALRQTSNDLASSQEEQRQFLARPLRVEIWLNIPFGAIAYRMLLLNAGQKPMSIKHQVEILSMQLAEDLASIPGIEIRSSIYAEKRHQPGQFALAKLSQAFQAWLQGTPSIDVRNTVMEQLLAESAIETLGTSLSGKSAPDDFRLFVEWLIEMDHEIWSVDPQFFGNETVLLGISAAVGAANRNGNLRSRMLRALGNLHHDAKFRNKDILATNRFNELRRGEDVRRVNVGQFTRDMVYRAFQEYFLSDGTKSMEECWKIGAASLS